MRMLSMRISSLRPCSVHASVHHVYAQHGLKALFKFGIFTLMLSIRIRNWCIHWACAQGTDAHAEHTHQFLTRMLRVRISPWCVCSACFEGIALLKIRLSIRVRNFERSNISRLGTFKSTAANLARTSGQLRAKPPVLLQERCQNNYLNKKIKTPVKNLRNCVTHVLAMCYPSTLSMDRSNLKRWYL